MSAMDILALIDAEIASLQQARAALTATAPAKRKPGRPKATATAAPAKKKRQMSPEGRARIAEAMRKRWAAAKKAAK
jgi:hypothetical protein